MAVQSKGEMITKLTSECLYDFNEAAKVLVSWTSIMLFEDFVGPEMLLKVFKRHLQKKKIF